jgi:cell shape-determining protein MreC
MMKHISGEQLGSALRRLAADLVEERRHTVRLERENEALRKQVEALQRALSEAQGQHVNAQKAA